MKSKPLDEYAFFMNIYQNLIKKNQQNQINIST